MQRFKMTYQEYTGEAFDKVNIKSWNNEEVGPDIILPLDIIDAMVKKIPSEKILLGHEVKQLEWSNQGVQIECGNGKLFSTEYAICTLPVGT